MNPNKEVKSKRGRKVIPPQWSRIIDLKDVDMDKLEVFVIEQDMIRATEDAGGVSKRIRQQWTPIFEPQDFWEQSSKPRLAQSQLNKRNLKTYGQKVTELRTLF